MGVYEPWNGSFILMLGQNRSAISKTMGSRHNWSTKTDISPMTDKIMMAIDEIMNMGRPKGSRSNMIAKTPQSQITSPCRA